MTYEFTIAGVSWANGMPVTKTEAIKVLMYWYGEDSVEAEKDLLFISREKLQQAIDYYVANNKEDKML